MSRHVEPDWVEIAQMLCVRAGMILKDIAGECVGDDERQGVILMLSARTRPSDLHIYEGER